PRTFKAQDPNRGNFKAYKNLRTSYRDDPPAFNGRISIPGKPDVERHVTLWAAHSKTTGNLILSGPVTADAKAQWARLGKTAAPANDQVRHVTMKEGTEPFPVKPHHMVLFTNPNTEAKTPGKEAPPKMFGYFNPGGEDPVVVISAFERTDRNGNIMLSGPVEVHDPEKTYDQQLARKEGRDMASEDPDVSHLMPEKGTDRDRSADDGPSR
ncbi:MAG: hypothetical protein JSR99_00005, partial [Proteobacteria bacterium]|nr:hypothetical protein [Pseudomonadota bacterium]